jgi:hypothetical protein
MTKHKATKSSMSMRDVDADQHETPLMAATRRSKGKKSWYRKPETWVAIGLSGMLIVGAALLFEENGGDRFHSCPIVMLTNENSAIRTNVVKSIK